MQTRTPASIALKATPWREENRLQRPTLQYPIKDAPTGRLCLQRWNLTPTTCRSDTLQNMPIAVRKLTQDEAARTFPRRGQNRDLSDYLEALSQLETGDAAEVSEEGVSTRALKRRMTQSAKQLGVTLKYARDTEGGVRFRILERQVAQPGLRRRGRPRKSA
jgi:hypothetical protein